MPRPRTLSDEQLLEMVLTLVHAEGPDAATFSAAAKVTGLSGSTLVQRFGTKAAMLRAALLYAWDRLDAETARLAAETPETPEGAVALLVGLSQGYGDDAAAYAEGLLILREDFRDPALRARGAAWNTALIAALSGRFPGHEAPEIIAQLLLSQWQGSLLWWGFAGKGRVADSVETELKRLVSALRLNGPVRA